MSQVKHYLHGVSFLHAHHVKLVRVMDRAEERAGLEDVGEQALMRGLATHFRLFVWGCAALGSGVDEMIGHIVQSGIPLPWSPPSLLHD